MPYRLALIVTLLVGSIGIAQEQVDQADAIRQGAALEQLSLRVRVTQAQPKAERVQIQWRRRGEGLGGEVIRGDFRAAGAGEDPSLIEVGQWTASLPLGDIVGKPRGWEFVTLTTRLPVVKRQKAEPLVDVVVEVELLAGGKVAARLAETSPKGSTVGLAFDGSTRQLLGLSSYVRQRRSRLESLFGAEKLLPTKYAIIGHLAGYGEGQGYAIRHCNPQILADDAACLRMLGMNGLVGRIELAAAAGMPEQFRQIYWGGPGSGSPMGMLKKKADEPDGCPFDPVLPGRMQESARKAIEEHKSAGAKESWALWWDEIGVAVKQHMLDCPRCGERFIQYCQSLKYTPEDFAKKEWTAVKPYPCWDAKPAIPAEGGEGLRYYCTFRFMTYATAQLFVEPAKMFKAAGIPLYAMQGPTPSWSGHSLDWHEFYDLHANTAMVFETSNRDPRSWQWESYLADIARGIAERHDMPLGCLIKPHRGAPEQRMLSLVARGCRVFEWYTYGPDYAKGDSFSQVPELLERVGRAGRFLAKAEDVLYGAKPVPAQVAFVSPRSSEIWGKMAEWGPAAFENAKWVYLALRHAGVSVDVLSEQQLAEGKLERYQAIYVSGPNLRRDAAGKLVEWVKNGGDLWTDALGMSRDEANRPMDLLGLGERKLQMWGSVEGYKATDLKPLVEKSVPEEADFTTANASLGREILAARPDARLTFKDGRPAVLQIALGKGRVTHNACWAGLLYSARVGRDDFDMAADFPAPIRDLIARPSLDRAAPPVAASCPTVEAVLLDNAGRRSVALINWTYRHATDPAQRYGGHLVEQASLRVSLPAAVKQVRSIAHGPLPVVREGGLAHVLLPRLAEIDLLVLD